MAQSEQMRVSLPVIAAVIRVIQSLRNGNCDVTDTHDYLTNSSPVPSLLAEDKNSPDLHGVTAMLT